MCFGIINVTRFLLLIFILLSNLLMVIFADRTNGGRLHGKTVFLPLFLNPKVNTPMEAIGFSIEFDLKNLEELFRIKNSTNKCQEQNVTAEETGQMDLEYNGKNYEENCLSFFICYRSFLDPVNRALKAQFQLNGMVKTDEIDLICNNQSRSIGEKHIVVFHGFKVKFCLVDGNDNNGQLKISGRLRLPFSSENEEEITFDLDNSDHQLSLHFGFNDVLLVIANGYKRIVTGGKLLLSDGNKMLQKNNPWLALDVALISSNGKLFGQNPKYSPLNDDSAMRYYRHFHVHHEPGCKFNKISNKNSKLMENGGVGQQQQSMLFECGPDILEQQSASSNQTQQKTVQCGVSSSTNSNGINQPELLIFGGEKVAETNKWPWLAYLFIRFEISNKNGQKFITDASCTGSILDEFHILTAAHCLHLNKEEMDPHQQYGFTDVKLLGIVVFAGQINVNDPNAQIRLAYGTKVRLHPKAFEGISGVLKAVVDVALLKMSEPFDFGDKVRPICLNGIGSADVFVNKLAPVTMIGWGKTSKDWQSKDRNINLHETNASVVSIEICKNAYRTALENKFMADFRTFVLTSYEREMIEDLAQQSVNGYLCVQGDHTSDGRPGDSGGPLLYFDQRTGSFYTIAVMSWHINPVKFRVYPPNLSFYVPVNSVSKWIQCTIDGRSDCGMWNING